MNEIKSTALNSLVMGDVFTMSGNGPYVVLNIRSADGQPTVVEYRQFRNGLPRGTVSQFYRAGLSTVLVLDRFYGPELFTKNVED